MNKENCALKLVDEIILLGTCYSVCRVLASCIPDSHPYRITSTKCHINAVFSLDDGHKVTRNM